MKDRFIVWRLADDDRDLWLPTSCESFEQAADAWLVGIQAGERMRITEMVPVALRDARQSHDHRPIERTQRQRRKHADAPAVSVNGIDLPSTSRLRDPSATGSQAFQALAALAPGEWHILSRGGAAVGAVASRFPGWIEREITPEGATRYRLTDAGRQMAAELRRLYAAMPT
jgi:hypothetical protein